MVSEASLGSGETGLLVIAAFFFKVVWFLCQNQLLQEGLQNYQGLTN